MIIGKIKTIRKVNLLMRKRFQRKKKKKVNKKMSHNLHLKFGMMQRNL